MNDILMHVGHKVIHAVLCLKINNNLHAISKKYIQFFKVTMNRTLFLFENFLRTEQKK